MGPGSGQTACRVLTVGVRQAWLRATTRRITSCVILTKIITLLKLGSHPDVGPALGIPALGHALGVFTGDAKWREMTKEQRNKLQRGECTHTGCPGSYGDQQRVFWRRRQRNQAAKGKEELAGDGSEERAESSRQEE